MHRLDMVDIVDMVYIKATVKWLDDTHFVTISYLKWAVNLILTHVLTINI